MHYTHLTEFSVEPQKQHVRMSDGDNTLQSPRDDNTKYEQHTNQNPHLGNHKGRAAILRLYGLIPVGFERS